MLIQSLFFILILKQSEPGCWIVRNTVQTHFFGLCVIAPVKRDRREELVHVDVQ